MELTEATLRRDGFDLHYWTGGVPDAPLVVFTHGATIDHHEWDATLPIVGARFRVLALDVRGHGLSRPAVFSTPPAVQDIVDLLDELNIKQALFVGHSLGGNLHQELVFHHPERVLGMVFVDCTWNFQKLTSIEKFTLKIARPLFALYPWQKLIDLSLSATANSPEVQEKLRPAMQSHTKAEITDIMMAATDCLHYEPGYRINKPLLMFLGDLDQTGNIRKVMPQWAAVEPDCKLLIVPGSRHSPNLDFPDLFHRELMAFLERFEP